MNKLAEKHILDDQNKNKKQTHYSIYLKWINNNEATYLLIHCKDMIDW